jgi:hypothetical protein
MWKYNGKAIRAGRGWTDSDGNQYPSNWLGLTTDAEKTAAGLVWEDDPAPFDNRFYWSAGNARALDDVTDEDGNVTLGLKSQYKAQTKATAGSMLQSTDWKIVKASEVADYSVDQATLDYRASVRTASNTIEAAIDAVADLTAFMALFDTPVDSDGNPTGKAPINNFPDEI